MLNSMEWFLLAVTASMSQNEDEQCSSFQFTHPRRNQWKV